MAKRYLGETRMGWPRRFLGLPLHPLLVHFPLVFWLCTPVLDGLALARQPQLWWRLALGVTIAGVAVGALAVITGLLDYVFLSETASNDVRLAARHGVRTGVVWCAMTVKLLIVAMSDGGRLLMAGCLIADLAICALLLQGFYLGTRIVYGDYR
jgi:uncharacterized membrane protein